MDKANEFTFLSLSKTQKTQEKFTEISTALTVNRINVSEAMEVLDELLESDLKLLVLDTEVGISDIKKMLELMQNDSISNKIPIIIISTSKETKELAKDFSNYQVVSILAYEDWKYQLSSFIKYLRCQSNKKDLLNENLHDSEMQNVVDPLTGALNRFGGDQKFEHLVAYYLESNEPFSVLMFDIDFFKKVNDTYGHDIGDEVLVSISSMIKDSIRKDDALFRYGGEEFVIFLSNANLDIAKKKAEDFRCEIQSKLYSQHNLKITASFGVVQYQKEQSLEMLIHQADIFLYKAKEAGRNTVVFD